jgi:general secretion pathway protein G
VIVSFNPALFEDTALQAAGKVSVLLFGIKLASGKLGGLLFGIKRRALALRKTPLIQGALAPGLLFSGCNHHLSTSSLAAEVRSSREGLPRPKASHPESGLTLVELIICVAIVAILASAAIPIARFQVKREKERELRRDLWEMREAIDRYKDAADKGAMQIKADSLGYPPDLETLVNGVDIQDKKVKFLRRIPVDPMTGTADWGLRSNQDDADSDSFGGQNVFDVHTKSQGTALDGTKYTTW